MLIRSLVAFALVLAGAAGAVTLHAMLSTGDSLFSWKRPDYLGVKDGRLARCKSSPNCVSSQADAADETHHVAPIAFRGSALEALAAVRKAVDGMPGTTVVRHDANYLYVEFRTKLMRYVDDVEFVHDEKAGAIHVRSASRLGRRDFGVNRARVEAIRSKVERRVQA